MKILLLNPPHPEDPPREIVVPPLGLAYLGASLEAAGHDVSILDALALRMGWSDLAKEASRCSPALLGLGGMTPVIGDSYRAAEILRPHARWIVLGGPHATVRGSRVREECPAIDFVIQGEAERTLPGLAQDLETGRAPASDVLSSERIDDLDGLPFPARHLLDTGTRYPYRYLPWGKGKIVTLMSSRGCPYRCIFCDKSVHGVRWRARSAGNVVEEIDRLVRAGGGALNSPGATARDPREARPPFLIFYDDLFTHERDRVLGICEGMRERGLAARWKCEARPDEVDAPLLSAMRGAGCEIIAFGVESGGAESLRFLRKGFSPERAEEAFRLAREAGLRTLAYAILGVPGESPRSARSSVRFVLGLDPDHAQFSTLAVFEGSALHAFATERGWVRPSSSWNPFDRDDSTGRLAVLPPGWTERDLRLVLRYAYVRLALRCRSIRVLAGIVTGVDGMEVATRLALRFVSWILGRRPRTASLEPRVGSMAGRDEGGST